MSDSAIVKQVTSQLAGMRLDAALAELFPDYSRSRVQQWIHDGQVRLDGCRAELNLPVMAVEEGAAAGASTTHGALARNARSLLIIRPQSGAGGCAPRPR